MVRLVAISGMGCQVGGIGSDNVVAEVQEIDIYWAYTRISTNDFVLGQWVKL